MAEIAPLRGIHYAATDSASLAQRVAPPYDVLTPEDRDALYFLHPENIVRIILNRPEATDWDAQASYSRASGCLKEWLKSGILIRDEEPALYGYRQEFTNPDTGARLSRGGFFCALKLEPYSAKVVLPHEETRPKAKQDRLLLTRATAANTEPIMALYEDPEASVDDVLATSEPFLHVEVGGDRHEVTRLHDPAAIACIQSHLAGRQVWIADGHHRYETALNYQAERRAARGAPSNPQEYDYLLTVLTSFEDPGMVVLPTHRLVCGLPENTVSDLPEVLQRWFELREVMDTDIWTEIEADPDQGEHIFGVVTSVGSWKARLRSDESLDSLADGHSSTWMRLDVSILQTLILDKALGIAPESIASGGQVGYARDRGEALDRVRTGEYQVALLLNPPSPHEVRRVTAHGEKMPAKSTFFYPKLWSGLMMRLLG